MGHLGHSRIVTLATVLLSLSLLAGCFKEFEAQKVVPPGGAGDLGSSGDYGSGGDGTSGDDDTTGNVTLVPSSIERLTDDSQTSVVPQGVTEVPVVRVLDQNGDPLPGVTVNFASSPNAGDISKASSLTDANGQASPGPWAPSTAGTHTLTASVSGLNSVTFTAYASLAPAPKKLVLFPKGNCETNDLEIYQGGGAHPTHQFIKTGECIEADEALALTLRSRCIDTGDRSRDSDFTDYPQADSTLTASSCGLIHN